MAITPSNVSTTQIPQNVNINNQQGTQGTQQTGSGNIGHTGQVPDATNNPGGTVLGYAAMMESIIAIMPAMSNADQDVLLAAISAKLKDAQSKNDADKIKGDEKVKSAEIQATKAKFEESAKKIQKAIDDDNAAGPFKWLKAIFEAIASIVMMVVGALLSVASLGTLSAVGALMIAAGGIGLYMAVDSMVQLGTGRSIMGNILHSAGVSDDTIAKVDMGLGIALAVVGIVLAIALMCTGVGAGAAAGDFAEAAQAIDKAAETADEIATVATQVQGAMAQVQTVANAINITGQVVNIISTGVVAGLEYDAASNQAGAMDDKADAKKIQALQAQLDEFIDMALSHMMNVHQGFENMMDQLMEAVQDKGKTMGHAKLAG